MWWPNDRIRLSMKHKKNNQWESREGNNLMKPKLLSFAASYLHKKRCLIECCHHSMQFCDFSHLAFPSQFYVYYHALRPHWKFDSNLKIRLHNGLTKNEYTNKCGKDASSHLDFDIYFSKLPLYFFIAWRRITTRTDPMPHCRRGWLEDHFMLARIRFILNIYDWIFFVSRQKAAVAFV